MTSQVFPKQTDQIYPTYSKIKYQIDELKCFPTWEEFLEYECVRCSGKFNMFERDNIQRYAYDVGLYNLVNWIQRCKELGHSYTKMYDPALKHYSAIHGPRERWITSDLEKKLFVRELEAQRSELEHKLQSVLSKLEGIRP